MQIALVTETFPPEVNGVAMTLLRLVRGLSSRGHHVHVIRPKPTAPLTLSSPKNWKDTYVQGIRIPSYPEAQIGIPFPRELKKIWQENPPDIIHVATEGPLGFFAIRTALSLNIPVVSSFHTNFDQYAKHYGVTPLKSTIAWYLRFAHNQTALTLVPNVDLIHSLENAGFKNCTHMGRGVDTTLFNPSKRNQKLRQSWGLKENDMAIIHVSRVASEKNIPLVAETIQKMQKILPSAKGIIVGDGPIRKQLEQQYPHLIFLGVKLEEELAECYASGDLFLFASITETFGNVVTEALASGLLVLTYDYAAGKQFIKNNDNGFTVSFNDSKRFTQKACELATSYKNEKFCDIRSLATQTASQIPWDHVIDSYEKNLYKVLSTNQTCTITSPDSTVTS